MVNYRRNFISGGTYFFTVNLADRHSACLTDNIELLRESFAWVRLARPFQIDAIVVLPDHLHTIWTLPEDDADYPGRWRAIKSRFVRRLRASGYRLASNARGECRIWQHRYWEHTIRDQDDFERHADYIHINPVKHGHTDAPSAWPYSSIHRYIREGVRNADWCNATPDELDGTHGER
ncbi:MAG TPA: transposase [Gammaproteobacteria bacterium]|nr:transposase [Gammaproteobacteria bacterium]